MFGKEGKRADYTPYSCMKVILSNAPGQGDHHGESAASEEAINHLTKHWAAIQAEVRDQTIRTKQLHNGEEKKTFQSIVESLISRTGIMHHLKADIQDKVLFLSFQTLHFLKNIWSEYL